MTSAATTSIPGYIAGTWDIDTSHSDVSFTVRHMMVSKVRGRFGAFSKARLTVLPGSSHFIPAGSGVMDRAEWLLAMVRPFLDAPMPETAAE